VLSGTASPCLSCTASAVHAPVCLGRFHEFGLFLGPLRRLLFFRRQGRFLLIFPLIFDFFGHGVHSQYLWGVFFGSTHDYTALWGSLSSGIVVYSISEYAERFYRKLAEVGASFCLGRLPCSGSSGLLIDARRDLLNVRSPGRRDTIGLPNILWSLVRRGHGLVSNCQRQKR